MLTVSLLSDFASSCTSKNIFFERAKAPIFEESFPHPFDFAYEPVAQIRENLLETFSKSC